MANQGPMVQPEEFSLAAAIFVPFTGALDDFHPVHDDKNPMSVLENLKKNKHAVKQSMILLAKLKQAKILEKAKGALEAEEQDETFIKERERGYARDRKALLERVKRARKTVRNEAAKRPQDGDGIETGGMNLRTKDTKRPSSISQLVGRKIELLFESSVRELNAYDSFMEGIIQAKREEVTQQQVQSVQESFSQSQSEDVFAQRKTSFVPTDPSIGSTSAGNNRLAEQRSSEQTHTWTGGSPTDSHIKQPQRSWSDGHPSAPNYSMETQRPPPDPRESTLTSPSHNSERRAYNQGRGDQDAHRGVPSLPLDHAPGLRKAKKLPEKKTATCKFWLQNRCRAGETCLYRHDYNTSRPPDMS